MLDDKRDSGEKYNNISDILAHWESLDAKGERGRIKKSFGSFGS